MEKSVVWIILNSPLVISVFGALVLAIFTNRIQQRARLGELEKARQTTLLDKKTDLMLRFFREYYSYFQAYSLNSINSYWLRHNMKPTDTNASGKTRKQIEEECSRSTQEYMVKRPGIAAMNVEIRILFQDAEINETVQSINALEDIIIRSDDIAKVVNASEKMDSHLHSLEVIMRKEIFGQKA